MDPDRAAALEVHQKARAELSIAPLTWDITLSNDAQRYANQLAAADQGMHHCQQLKELKQSENLACCRSAWPNAYRMSSELWYAEKKDWKGGVVQLEDVHAWGHYTQMIWSTTTLVGMALAVAPSGATYVVARYRPQGNYLGQSLEGSAATEVVKAKKPAKDKSFVKYASHKAPGPPVNKYDRFEQYRPGPPWSGIVPPMMPGPGAPWMPGFMGPFGPFG